MKGTPVIASLSILVPALAPAAPTAAVAAAAARAPGLEPEEKELVRRVEE